MTSPEQASTAGLSEPTPNVPRYYSQLKKAHKERVVPELKEGDLEESFVRGAGLSMFVPYTLLMQITLGHRKRSWRTIREQDGEQCTDTAQADWSPRLVSRDSFAQAKQKVGEKDIAG